MFAASNNTNLVSTPVLQQNVVTCHVAGGALAILMTQVARQHLSHILHIAAGALCIVWMPSSASALQSHSHLTHSLQG